MTRICTKHRILRSKCLALSALVNLAIDSKKVREDILAEKLLEKFLNVFSSFDNLKEKLVY